jgi:type IV secretory pathway VirD2 relaxase
MNDFRTVRGFEDVWRPPVQPRRRTPETVLSVGPSTTGADSRARLTRLANRVPEVMVKITGRTRSTAHLRSHLEYVSRNGELPLENPDGVELSGREAVKALADDWSALALSDSRRRANSPYSLSVVLSMPAATDPTVVRDAGRAFARTLFADRFDYVFALHTDADHPHVHLSIRSLGFAGERLNPKKADLETWRQLFAQALRDRGVEAEATPRRARGVTRKAERQPLRKFRERHEAGLGQPAQVRRSAYREAAKAAFQGDAKPRDWERKAIQRQSAIRGLYLAQARLLQASASSVDRALGDKVDAFVRAMPAPDSQRLALARELRAANRSSPDRDRGRER